MKYLVSGYIGFDNFGDEAIAHVLTEKLKKSGAEKITLISSNPDKTKIIHHVDSCGMFNFIKPLIESDCLISGGGSLLQDVTSLKSLIYYLGVIFTALILGKKVIIFAQGIGPINSKLGRFLTKNILKYAEKISVRDKNSQEMLSDWNIESELVNDPIFDLEVDKKNKTGEVGIQLRNFQGVTNTFLEKLAEEVTKHFSDKKICLISLQDSLDLPVCERFKEILKSKSDVDSEIYYNLPLNEVIEKISELEYLIAMRFHANVIGIKAGVKTLAINYDPKVENLAQKYNLPVINLNETDFESEFNALCIQ